MLNVFRTVDPGVALATFLMVLMAGMAMGYIVTLVMRHSSTLPLRQAVGMKKKEAKKGLAKFFWGFLNKLLNCDFCLAFWLGLIYWGFEPVQILASASLAVLVRKLIAPTQSERNPI